MQQVQCRLLQLLQTWRKQVEEGMDRGEAGNGVALVVLDGTFDVLVAQVCGDAVVPGRLLAVEVLEHGLDDAARRQTYLLLEFLADLVARLALDLADVAFSEEREYLPDEVDLLLAVLRKRVAERLDDCLALLGLLVDLVEDRPQMLVDVLLQHLRQSLGEGTRPQELGIEVSVDGVIPEILVLLVQRLAHPHLVVDVLLRTVLDPHVPQLQRNLAVGDHGSSVSPSVHDVDLRDHSQRTGALGVPTPGQVQPLRSSHVSVGRNNSQDNCPFLSTVTFGHFDSDLFDVCDLVPHGNLSDSRQVDESQVGTLVRVDSQFDGLVDNTLVPASHFLSLVLNGLPNVVEVRVLLVLAQLLEDAVGLGSG
jgi:hypothetical protein